MSNTPTTRIPSAPSTYTGLTPARQRLVDLLARVHFGRVLDLHVRRGEPLFDPPPRVIRTVKLSGTSHPRSTSVPRAAAGGHELRDLMRLLDRTSDGVIGR